MPTIGIFITYANSNFTEIKKPQEQMLTHLFSCVWLSKIKTATILYK
jgi:hypothetical protein